MKINIILILNKKSIDINSKMYCHLMPAIAVNNV
jgi:hypothetical protein